MHFDGGMIDDREGESQGIDDACSSSCTNVCGSQWFVYDVVYIVVVGVVVVRTKSTRLNSEEGLNAGVYICPLVRLIYPNECNPQTLLPRRAAVVNDCLRFGRSLVVASAVPFSRP